MEYVYSELDPNVRNIATSADLNDYYNKSHTDTNQYTSSYLENWINAETTVLENNFSNYYTTTYLDNFFTTLATLDYLHLKYTNSVVLAQNYYDKTETDNLFTNLNSISDDLTVGSTGDNHITINTTGAATGYTLIESKGGYNSVWDLQNGTHWQAWSSIKVKGSSFMDFSYHDNLIVHYKSLANWSDDRLKENEQLIENACETLSKLRPQIYDKKPDGKR